jgi:hypothetical protein
MSSQGMVLCFLSFCCLHLLRALHQYPDWLIKRCPTNCNFLTLVSVFSRDQGKKEFLPSVLIILWQPPHTTDLNVNSATYVSCSRSSFRSKMDLFLSPLLRVRFDMSFWRTCFPCLVAIAIENVGCLTRCLNLASVAWASSWNLTGKLDIPFGDLDVRNLACRWDGDWRRVLSGYRCGWIGGGWVGWKPFLGLVLWPTRGDHNEATLISMSSPPCSSTSISVISGPLSPTDDSHANHLTEKLAFWPLIFSINVVWLALFSS